MITRQQANVAAAQDSGRYAGRVADLLEQSHGLAEAGPAACRVGHVLEPTKYEEGLRPGACRAVGSRTSRESQGRLAGEAADEDPQSLNHSAIGLAQPVPRTVQHSLDAAMPLLDETGRIGPHHGVDPSQRGQQIARGEHTDPARGEFDRQR
jgi:hypothetical protein